MTPPQERTISPTWLRILGLTALALGLSVFACWPMLAAYPNTQSFDGIFIQEMLEAARVSVTRYHELPLWNPYQCGGVPLWDNPQGMGAAPLFWPLVALSDTTRAMELWYVLHSAAGFISMWILARHELKVSRAACIVASGMWAFSGAHSQHLSGGGFNWAPFFFLPLAVFFWRRAETDLRMAVGLGILCALTIMGGGAYPVVFVGLLLVAETLTRLRSLRRVTFIARAAAVAGVVAFCVSAARFIPVIYQLRSHVRPIGDEFDALQWSTLKDMFLSRTHSRGVAGQQYVWPEFGDYVGPFLLGLSLLGVVLGAVENAWLFVVLLWAFLLMLGHEWAWAPWSILKGHVYPFKEMRVPSRFNASVTCFLAAFAGVGIDRATTLSRRVFRSHRLGDAARTVLLAIGLVGVGDMIAVGTTVSSVSFGDPPMATTLVPSKKLYLEGPGLASFVDQPRQNRGRFDCWEEWAFEQGAALWAGDVPQARSGSEGARVAWVDRTQNSFTVQIDVKEPSRILLNTSYDRGWRSNVGTVTDNDKLLAVDVPPGEHTMIVKYWPRGLTSGLFISAFAVAGVIAFFVWDARRRRAS